MKVEKIKFGTLCDGTKIHLFTVKNDSMSFSCTEYGCTLTSIVLNGKNGKKTDVLLGFSTFEGYLNTKYCFGAIVGRFANRIGTASFSVNGKNYSLDKNDGPNTLHGGYEGYDKMVWKGEEISGKDIAGVKFTRISPDGEQGFPGNLKIEISYILDDNNNLSCLYKAETDKATPINITNHAYFNLAGNGSVLDHEMRMNSSYVLDIDSRLIPTGKLNPVVDTPFDFTNTKKIGADISKVGSGYDHCFVTEIYSEDNKQCGVPLNSEDLVEFAEVTEPLSGNTMSVFTNMEGCQFYTANGLKGLVGKNGLVYENHDAFCLETQCFPDSPNKAEFPTCILKPGQTFTAKTIYSFNK
jgi:aldose 1-epimerase